MGQILWVKRDIYILFLRLDNLKLCSYKNWKNLLRAQARLGQKKKKKTRLKREGGGKLDNTIWTFYQ